jgi:hypothetical protein
VAVVTRPIPAGQAYPSRSRRERFRIQAPVDQEANDLDVGGPHGERQCRRARSILGAKVCAMIEEQPQQACCPRVRRGHEQRRPFRRGTCVDVGAPCQQELDFFDVGNGPHQRGRTRGVGPVRVGAVLEQKLQRPGVGEQGRRHQGRRSLGIHLVRAHPTGEQSPDLASGSPLQGREERIARGIMSSRIRSSRIGLSGHRGGEERDERQSDEHHGRPP